MGPNNNSQPPRDERFRQHEIAKMMSWWDANVWIHKRYKMASDYIDQGLEGIGLARLSAAEATDVNRKLELAEKALSTSNSLSQFTDRARVIEEAGKTWDADSGLQIAGRRADFINTALWNAHLERLSPLEVDRHNASGGGDQHTREMVVNSLRSDFAKDLASGAHVLPGRPRGAAREWELAQRDDYIDNRLAKSGLPSLTADERRRQ